jgi:hypothetical protein
VLKRLTRAAGDLLRFSSRFVADPAFRRTVQAARADDAVTEVQRREHRAAPPEARPFRFVDSRALALAATEPDDSVGASINLVLGELGAAARFAGVSTALHAAQGLADRLQLPLRIVTLTETGPTVAPDLDPAPAMVTRGQLAGARFGADDVWLVTHWTTAYAAHVAATAGRLRRDQVVSLVQDYEPGFAGWSAASEAAAATYRAGFRLLVNSRPLADHLRGHGVPVEDPLVFAPALLDGLAPRQDGAPAQVLFYGRPSKPRNMFRLGLAALDTAAAMLGPRAAEVRFVSAGEHHSDVALANGAVLRSRGAVDLTAYRELLATSRVVLSLQASPHPSHPPLEAALAGATAVTNAFGTTREGLHPRLRPVAAEPEVLAAAIVAGLAEKPATASVPFAPGVLGHPFDDVLDRLAEGLVG